MSAHNVGYEFNSTIRDCDAAGRAKLGSTIGELARTLPDTRVRSFLFGGNLPIQIWLTCEEAQPTSAEIQRRSEIACLVAKVSRVLVLILYCDERGSVIGARCSQVAAPPVLRRDYPTLVAEADRVRTRFIKMDQPKRREKKGR